MRFRGVACQVTRLCVSGCVILLTARLLVSGAYCHDAGLLRFLFGAIPATLSADTLYRAATKNHILSRAIGPPNAGLMSQSCLILFGVATPRALRSASRLLLCHDPGAYAPN